MKKIAIIGGGAAGMACAVLLAGRADCLVTVYERSDRLGKKLSATGNGQGNVTNVNLSRERYFSDDLNRVEEVITRFGASDAIAFLERMGGLFLPDARGRVYPAGKQASAVTDLFRMEIAQKGAAVKFGAKITSLIKRGEKFTLQWEGGSAQADAVILCGGGLAAPNFGTDGNAYALAKAFGHTVTPCSPALVQLRCDPASVRGLKGIRVDAQATVCRKGKSVYTVRGDVLFTESGVSGDAIFRASSYAREGDVLHLDLLPDVSCERLRKAVSLRAEDKLLCIVNNGLGRALEKRAQGNEERLLSLIKDFTLTVTGSLGYAYAQVTKGGIPLAETTSALMSRLCENLYFAGEILNVDGECGGYNLHWAFASAYTVCKEGFRCC